TTYGSKRTVEAFSPDLANLRTGMSLQEALSEVKEVQILESDKFYYHSLFQDILSSLENVVQVVEDAGLGIAYLDVDGLDHIYGDDNSICTLLKSVISEEWNAKIGFGNSKFLSYLAANIGFQMKTSFVPEDLLERASTDVLPIKRSTIDQLHEFDLHTLRDVSRVPLGPMQAQFGKEGKLIWELSHGIDRRRLTPRNINDEITEFLEFSEPVILVQNMLMGVELLVEKLLMRSDRRGRGASTIIISGQSDRGSLWERRFTFKAPVCDKNRIICRLKVGLQKMHMPGPISEIAVTLKNLTSVFGNQISLFRHSRNSERLSEAVKQLEVLLDKPIPIFYIREVEPWSRIPERRYALVRFGT
ncbi:hypothetical protein FIM04_03715, partial [SAR202 cluster bacterium AC-409-J13_OGT_754m]|nr:hypothetical protein [SAR202 cluster bacterium AC-409-J13_OGT_754m]